MYTLINIFYIHIYIYIKFRKEKKCFQRVVSVFNSSFSCQFCYQCLGNDIKLNFFRTSQIQICQTKVNGCQFY